MGSTHDDWIAAIVLAAGMSRRMGTTKALLDFGGKPLIARTIDSLRDASIHPTVIVTGHQPQAIESATAHLGVNFVQNERYESGGMISSIQTGVRSIAQACDALFIVLGDHAPPKPATLRAMSGAWRESPTAIVLPIFESKHGHPILISSSLAPEILALTENLTLATIVKAHSQDSRDVIVDDPAILEDIDTPEDYNRALQRWARANMSGEQEHVR